MLWKRGTINPNSRARSFSLSVSDNGLKKLSLETFCRNSLPHSMKWSLLSDRREWGVCVCVWWGGLNRTGNLADGADRGTKCSACDLAVLSDATARQQLVFNSRCLGRDRTVCGSTKPGCCLMAGWYRPNKLTACHLWLQWNRKDLWKSHIYKTVTQ